MFSIFFLLDSIVMDLIFLVEDLIHLAVLIGIVIFVYRCFKKKGNGRK